LIEKHTVKDLAGNTDQLYLRVEGLMKFGLYGEAETILDQMLSQQQDDTFALNKKGIILAQRGDFPGAEALFWQVLSIDREMAVAWNNLGNVCLQTGRAQEAVNHYQRAIDIDPDYANAYENLAAAYRQLGELDLSVQAIRKTKYTRQVGQLWGRFSNLFHKDH
jgi:tetratricopeptide (TPR) repeat protein